MLVISYSRNLLLFPLWTLERDKLSSLPCSLLLTSSLCDSHWAPRLLPSTPLWRQTSFLSPPTSSHEEELKDRTLYRPRKNHRDLRARVQLTHQKCIIFNGHQSVFMIYRIRKNSTKMKGLSFRQKDPSVENFWGKIRLGGYFISIWYGILFFLH